MRDGLLEAKTDPLLVLQDTDVDWECASLLLHVGKHGTRILQFQLIRDSPFLLINTRS